MSSGVRNVWLRFPPHRLHANERWITGWSVVPELICHPAFPLPWKLLPASPRAMWRVHANRLPGSFEFLQACKSRRQDLEVLFVCSSLYTIHGPPTCASSFHGSALAAVPRPLIRQQCGVSMRPSPGTCDPVGLQGPTPRPRGFSLYTRS